MRWQRVGLLPNTGPPRGGAGHPNIHRTHALPECLVVGGEERESNLGNTRR